MSDLGLEAPDADSAEQSQDAIPELVEDHELPVAAEAPLEANEADAVEQERALSVDDDEYR
jgi:hypothetical protein